MAKSVFVPKVVPVEGVDGRFIREWSGWEHVQWEDALTGARLANGHIAFGTMRTVGMALSLCTEDGKRLFGGTSAKDLELCANSVSRDDTATIFKQVCDLNGVLTKTDQVEVAEGN